MRGRSYRSKKWHHRMRPFPVNPRGVSRLESDSFDGVVKNLMAMPPHYHTALLLRFWALPFPLYFRLVVIWSLEQYEHSLGSKSVALQLIMNFEKWVNSVFQERASKDFLKNPPREEMKWCENVVLLMIFWWTFQKCKIVRNEDKWVKKRGSIA